MNNPKSNKELSKSFDLPATIHHHTTQAVLSMPFAHGATVKNAPMVDGVVHSLEQWHRNAVVAPVASLSSHISTQIEGFTQGIAANMLFKPKTDASGPVKQEKSRLKGHKKTAMGKNERLKAGNDEGPIVCIEFTRGKRRVYRSSTGDKTDSKTVDFHISDDHVTHHRRLRDAMANYLLPQGFPDSVAPQYAAYMGWRGVQYFFGGAMSVFTTRSLLGAVGVANKHSGEAAAAINWVVKDGAGRMGRFLFARWGRELDCELKQFRLGGDFLMEAGAALELSTALAPRLFLPLACTANLAKNLAAVAASSTRAPIYRTFARQNNLADITAKGESVANLADVLGTLCGIVLAKGNFPVVPTFAALSVGYLVASRREVDSVELPYLNRARLSVAARKFLNTGTVPEPREANDKEPLLPWSDPTAGRIVLGATVQDACGDPQELKTSLDAFKGRQYALTYRPDTKKVYVMLKEGADTISALQGAVAAHCVLHLVGAAESNRKRSASGEGGNSVVEKNGGAIGKLRRHAQSVLNSSDAVSYIAANGAEIYSQFEDQAKSGGWKLPLTMLNPSETRLVTV